MSEKILRFEITKEFLEKVGDNSLIGSLLNLNEMCALPFYKEVVLVFPEADNGPKQISINDYVIRCLMNDILWLSRAGISVRTERKV